MSFIDKQKAGRRAERGTEEGENKEGKEIGEEKRTETFGKHVLSLSEPGA